MKSVEDQAMKHYIESLKQIFATAPNRHEAAILSSRHDNHFRALEQQVPIDLEGSVEASSVTAKELRSTEESGQERGYDKTSGLESGRVF